MFLNPQSVSLAACSQDSPSTCTRLISGYGYFMTSWYILLKQVVQHCATLNLPTKNEAFHGFSGFSISHDPIWSPSSPMISTILDPIFHIFLTCGSVVPPGPRRPRRRRGPRPRASPAAPGSPCGAWTPAAPAPGATSHHRARPPRSWRWWPPRWRRRSWRPASPAATTCPPGSWDPTATASHGSAKFPSCTSSKWVADPEPTSHSNRQGQAPTGHPGRKHARSHWKWQNPCGPSPVVGRSPSSEPFPTAYHCSRPPSPGCRRWCPEIQNAWAHPPRFLAPPPSFPPDYRPKWQRWSRRCPPRATRPYASVPTNPKLPSRSVAAHRQKWRLEPLWPWSKFLVFESPPESRPMLFPTSRGDFASFAVELDSPQKWQAPLCSGVSSGQVPLILARQWHRWRQNLQCFAARWGQREMPRTKRDPKASVKGWVAWESTPDKMERSYEPMMWYS